MIWSPSATPEAIRGKRGKPDHLEIWILQTDANHLRVHSVAGADSPVYLNAALELTPLHHGINVALGKIGRVGAEVPVIFERHGPHAGLGGVDRDLDHILRPEYEIRIRVNVRIDCANQKIVLDSGMNLENLRVILEHLIEVVLRIELPHTL